ncbi:hypothetical protein [Ralstonia phage RP13]|nr:hypothetical protein [Ralstonia phage RP13]
MKIEPINPCLNLDFTSRRNQDQFNNILDVMTTKKQYKFAQLFYVKGKTEKPFCILITEHHDYSNANTHWMIDPELPQYDIATDKGTLTPSVDIEKEKHWFNTESEAMHFMCQFYAGQL